MRRSLLALFFLGLVQSVFALDIHSNLIGYWKLDNNHHNLGTHAQYQSNGYSYEDAVMGQGIKLTGDVGSYGYFYNNSALDFNTDATLVAWLKFEEIKDKQYIFSKLGNSTSEGWTLHVEIDGDDKKLVLLADGQALINENIDIQEGEFYQFAMTRRGNWISLYLNSKWIKTVGFNINTQSGGGCLLGQYNLANNEGLNFKGVVDEIALWERGLAQGEVFMLYNWGKGRDASQSIENYEYLFDNFGIVFTDDLIRLAEKLERDPVKIYNYVYENIKFEPYEGALKTAQLVYETKAGNAYDQSSLLIALYRISGIPAYYRHTETVSENTIAKEWVFVSALVPLEAIRGWSEDDEEQWVMLAPWKKSEWKIEPRNPVFIEDLGDNDELKFDFEGYLQGSRQEDALEYLFQKAKDYLNQNGHLSLSDKSNRYRLRPMTKTLLGNSAAHTLFQDNYEAMRSGEKGVKRVEITESKRRYFTVQIERTDGTVLANKTLRYLDVARKKLYVDSVQATNGQYKVRLMLDDEELTSQWPLNGDEYFHIRFKDDYRGQNARNNSAIKVETAHMGVGVLHNLYTLQNIKDLYQEITELQTNNPAIIAPYIEALAIRTYAYTQVQALETLHHLFGYERTHLTGVIFIGFPDGLNGFEAADNKVGLIANMKTDIPLDWSRSISGVDFNSDLWDLYWRLKIYIASQYEGKIYEDILGIEGYSTWHVFRKAQEAGIELKHVTQADINGTTINGLNPTDGNGVALGVNYDHDTISELISYLNEGIENAAFLPVYRIDENHVGYMTYNDFNIAMKYNGDGGGGSDVSNYNLNDVYRVVLPSKKFNSNGEVVSEEDPDFFAKFVEFLNIKGVNPSSTEPAPEVEISQLAEPERTLAIMRNAFESAGDPVDVARGEFYIDENADILITGRGMNLSITRQYRSGFDYNGPFGYGWTHEHNVSLRFLNDNENPDVVFVNNRGDAVRFEWNVESSSYETLDGQRYSLSKNNGHLILEDQNKRLMTFDSLGRILKRTSVNQNNYLNYSYYSNGPSEGLLEKITDPIGRSLYFFYNESGDAVGKIKEVRDFKNRSVYYFYEDGFQNLTRVVDLRGYERKYKYLNNQFYGALDHNISEITNESGDSLRLYYYRNDKVSYHENDKGEIFHFDYSSFNNYTTVWNEEGYRKKFFYNHYGEVTKIIDEKNNITEKTYNIDRTVDQIIDARGYVTKFEYDSEKNIISKLDVTSGIIWGYEYDLRFNKIKKATDPENNVIEYEYDDYGNLVKTVLPNGQELLYSYDDYGNVLSEQDAEGYRSVYEYDSNSLHPISFTDKNKNYHQYSYNDLGYLEHSIDPEGNKTSFEFDEQGRTVKTTLPNGAMYRTIYTPLGQIKSQIDALGNVVSYEYDIARDMVVGASLKKITDQMGYTQTFEYDQLGNVIKEKNAEGNIAESTYDGLSRLSSETNALGHTVYIDYDGVGNISHRYYMKRTIGNINPVRVDLEWNTYDSLDRLIEKKVGTTGNKLLRSTFTYDGNSNLKTETNHYGLVTKYEYDNFNHMVKKTVGWGTENPRIFEYDYDSRGLLIKAIDAMGRIKTFDYDGNGNRVLEKCYVNHLAFDEDNPFKKELFYYDSLNRVVKRIDGIGNIYQFKYNKIGQKINDIDPYGNENSYEFDIAGRLEAFIDKKGNRTEYGYNPRSEKIWIKNTKQNKRYFTYNKIGQLLSSTDEEGITAKNYYNALGQLIGKADGLGNHWSFAYDERGNKILQQTPEGVAVRYEYDIFNRITKTIRNSDQVTVDYDDENLIVTTTKFDRTLIKYNINGNGDDIIEEQDKKIVIQKVEKNIFGETKAVYEAWGSVDQEKTSYTYYDDGQLEKIIDDRDVSILYTYDERGMLKRVYDGDGVDYREFTYDNNGNLISKRMQDGMVLNYKYDRLDRLTNIYKGDELQRKLSYDILSNVTEAIEYNEGRSTHVTQSNFDDLNRIISQSQDSKSISMTYFNNSQIETLSQSDSSVITFAYDEAGRLESKSGLDAHVSWSYNKSSQLSRAEFGESLKLDIQYNKDGFPDSRKYSNSSNENVYHYTNSFIDGVNEYTFQTSSGVPTRIMAFSNPEGPLGLDYSIEYNDRYRVTSYGSNGEVYEYDSIGNMKSKVDATLQGPVAIQFGAVNSDNEYPSVSNHTFSYDKRGNLISDGVKHYRYDWANRLVEVKEGEVLVASYSYDAFDRRKSKSVYADSKHIEFVYHGTRVIEEYENNDLARSFIYGSYVDDPVAMKSNNQLFYYIKDRQYNVIALTNSVGDVVESYRYSAFGQVMFFNETSPISEPLTGNPYGFTGRRLDAESGLWFYRARSYNPAIARFMQRDPAGYVDGMSMYSYVRNNPFGYVDPTGLKGTKASSDNVNSKKRIPVRPDFGTPVQICHGFTAGKQRVPGTTFTDSFVGGKWYRSGSNSNIIGNYASGLIGGIASTPSTLGNTIVWMFEVANTDTVNIFDVDWSGNYHGVGGNAGRPSMPEYKDRFYAEPIKEFTREVVYEDVQHDSLITGGGDFAGQLIGEAAGGFLAKRALQFTKNSISSMKVLDDVLPDEPITDPSRLLEPPSSINPNLDSAPIEGVELPVGYRFNQAVSPEQRSPGRFGTDDYIPDISYVRNELAVIPDFKPEISGVRQVEVIRPVRAQRSVVGPQVQDNIDYPGGGTQIEILEYDRSNPFVRFVVGEEPLQ